MMSTEFFPWGTYLMDVSRCQIHKLPLPIAIIAVRVFQLHWTGGLSASKCPLRVDNVGTRGRGACDISLGILALCDS